jgi:hypothetical protein
MRARPHALRGLLIAGVVLYSVFGNGHFGAFDLFWVVIFIVVAVAILSGVLRTNRWGRGASDLDEPVTVPPAAPQAPATQPAAATTTTASATSAPDTPTANLDQLERIGKMHSEGMLTDAEFATAKAKLLGRTS